MEIGADSWAKLLFGQWNKWGDIPIFHRVVMEKWTLSHKLEKVGHSDLNKIWPKVCMYQIWIDSDFQLRVNIDERTLNWTVY